MKPKVFIKPVHVLLSEKQYKMLRKHSFKTNRSVGSIIRSLIENLKDVKTLLLVIGMVGGMIALYKIREPELMAYNRHMCAVYGMYEDCKTPLPEELRLK
jgi:hypothetical protein